jgi:hypothetical protein
MSIIPSSKNTTFQSMPASLVAGEASNLGDLLHADSGGHRIQGRHANGRHAAHLAELPGVLGSPVLDGVGRPQHGRHGQHQQDLRRDNSWMTKAWLQTKQSTMSRRRQPAAGDRVAQVSRQRTRSPRCFSGTAFDVRSMRDLPRHCAAPGGGRLARPARPG